MDQEGDQRTGQLSSPQNKGLGSGSGQGEARLGSARLCAVMKRVEPPRGPLGHLGRSSAQLTPDQAAELARRTQQVMLAIGMLVAGTANTITCKMAMAAQAIGRDGTLKPFKHPLFMAMGMFVGETFCLGLYKLQRRGKKDCNMPRYVCLLPALCDICGTCIMYVGLTLTTASTYQMLRGSVIIFTGLSSKIFLGRKQRAFHWVAMFCTFFGLMFVGVASMDNNNSSQPAQILAAINPGLGDALVILSQIFVAGQMCAEESLLSGYNAPPLLAVGWEGVWGFSCLTSFLFILQHIPGTPLEDSVDALHQIRTQPIILFFMLGNATSIAVFNYCGISITKNSSAAYRTVLDSLRTISVWLIGLAEGGETFRWLQMLGFFFMVLGTLVHSESVKLACFSHEYECTNVADGKSDLEGRCASLQEALISSEKRTSPLMKDFFTPRLTRYALKMNT